MVCVSANFCVSPGLGDLRAVNFQSSQSTEEKEIYTKQHSSVQPPTIPEENAE